MALAQREERLDPGGAVSLRCSTRSAAGIKPGLVLDRHRSRRSDRAPPWRPAISSASQTSKIALRRRGRPAGNFGDQGPGLLRAGAMHRASNPVIPIGLEQTGECGHVEPPGARRRGRDCRSRRRPEVLRHRTAGRRGHRPYNRPVFVRPSPGANTGTVVSSPWIFSAAKTCRRIPATTGIDQLVGRLSDPIGQR